MTESYRDRLNEIDHKCLNEDLKFYDLRSLFESIAPKLSAEDKEEIKKVIQNTNDAETIAAVLQAKAMDEKNESLEESFYVHDQSLVDDWIEQDLTFDIEQDGVYSFINASEARKALETAMSHGYRDAWRETNKVYISGDKVNESLEERYDFDLVDNAIDHFLYDLGREPEVDDVIEYIENTSPEEVPEDFDKYQKWADDISCEISARLSESLEEELIEDVISREQYEKEKEELANKFDELRRNKVSSYDYRYKALLKKEKELNKLGREVKAQELGGVVFNKAKLTNLIKKLTGLDTLKTHSTAIRGYHNIGSGSFTIEQEGQNSFRLSFYRNRNIQDEVKTKLIDLGFKVSEFGGDLLIDDIQIPRNESLEEKLIPAPQEVVDELINILNKYGFVLDDSFKVNPGKTFMGDTHMQVINPESLVDMSDEIDIQDQLQKYVTQDLIDEIHDLDQKSDCPITWNFGPNKDGQVTGGLDIMKQYVEESYKDVYYVIVDKHGNQLSRPTKDDSELWDRVESRDPKGTRGLKVVVYTGKVDEKLSEASYGGSYDIEDDMFFTKEELMEFGYDLVEQFSAWAEGTCELSDLYMTSPVDLFIAVSDEDGAEHQAKVKIDMRKIKLPKDIYKYSDIILKQWKDSYNEYHDYDESLNEDTVKQNGKWVNKGKEGTHGKFNTKKAADAQRKAMFANGYKEALSDEKEYKAFLGKNKNANKKFDYKKYGKYFDKDGKIIPELENEFFSTIKTANLSEAYIDADKDILNKNNYLREDYNSFLTLADKDANKLRNEYDKGDKSIFDILTSLNYIQDDPDSVYMYKEVSDGYAIVFDLSSLDEGRNYVKYFVVDENNNIPKGYTITKLLIEDYQQNKDEWGEPYSYDEVERELKSITDNWTDKEGTIRCYWEQEKNYGLQILKKHYKYVETSDGRTGKGEDMSWVISYSSPKEN